MRFSFADQVSQVAQPLVLPVRGAIDLTRALRRLSNDVARVVQASAIAQRFEGEAASIAEALVADGAEVRRILLVGLGTGPLDTNGLMEKAGGAVAVKLLTSGVTAISVDFTGLEGVGLDQAAARFAYGARLRSWRHDVYRTKLPKSQKPTLSDIEIVGARGAADAWTTLSAIADGVEFTRTLVTEPANVIYPESFVARCERLATLGVEIEILGEDEMRAAGMGALLGVSQGSARPPRLLVMRWNGLDSATERKPVVFVGKGVTFDTGGISIKPAAGMEDMKWDMGGAGAVAGTMLALASRKAKAHVVGICGLVENMPSGTAQRPGDVVVSMSGQTVEVINTDAEGRLVLCDAMTWVQRKYKPEVMIDLATLTGAIIISLGHEYAGLFSNNDELAEQLLAAGKASGNPLWRMPMGEAYDKQIDSPIADMKNVGGREGGSITAAQFLQRFVDEGVRWAHLDIAGTVWTAKPGPTWEKGASGYGVALLNQLVADHFEG
ncbi:leucyl aminopeptidase [Aquisediminimonas sediminicola]|uniref:leucyl aminopeptidase n=1 Tax=Alteraquisediminimonas sediminicola TaxID=2676787 RepID=UPI001C8F020E